MYDTGARQYVMKMTFDLTNGLFKSGMINNIMLQVILSPLCEREKRHALHASEEIRPD